MLIKSILYSLIAISVSMYTVKAQSTVVTFQPGSSTGIDADINSSLPTTNFGTSASLDASRDVNNVIIRGNLQFDLSSIPVNAIINSAQLTLFGVAHSGINPCYLQKNIAPWAPTTITWNTAVATTAVGQIALAQSASSTQNYVLDVKAFVQDMVNVPATNYGFTLVKQDETSTGAMVFASSDNRGSAYRPQLVISYSLPMDIKGYMTPATGAASANGALNVTIQNGVPPYTYSWSDGSTTKDIFSKLPGLYTLLVTDNLGNQTKKHFIIGAENTPITVTIAPDGLSGKDGMIQVRDNGTLINDNYKNNVNTQATRATASGWLTSRSLIEFDLFSIPTNAVVNNASLQLFGNGHNPLNRPNDSYLLQNSAPWLEETLTWGNQPGTLASPSIYMPGTTSANQNTTLDVTGQVQNWVQNPASNYGWKLKLADEVTASYTILNYGSFDNTTPSLRPSLVITITIPVPTDAQRNWSMEETYDQNGQVIATTKAYADDLGRPTQSLSKDANGDVFTVQTIYDAYGRAAVNSLPAYSGNSLAYNTQFMLSTLGQEFNYTNFDVTGKITTPDAVQVGLPNTLGTYYSDLNTLDTWQATATNPYTRTNFMASAYGETKTVNGADDSYKAGTGREVRNYSMVCGDELKYILGATNSYKVYTTAGFPLTSTPLAITAANYIKASKSITTSPDNKETVSYSIGDKVIATCMSGLAGPDNCSMPTIQNYMDWYGTQSIDIHLPDANKTSLSLPLPAYWTEFGNVSLTNAQISYTITDMRTETVLQNSTDYTINTTTRAVTFSTAYLAANTGKPLFLRINMTIDNAVVTTILAGNYIVPKGIVQYALDYGRWSVNYYDVAGNLRKTVSPKGINCSSPGTIAMASTYDYSHLGQLIAKQTPDEGLTEYAYDIEGKARFAQNAIQKLNNKFSYSNYDLHGRVTETGEFTNTSGAGTNGVYFQNYYNNYTAPFTGNIASSTIVNLYDGLVDTYCNDAFFTCYEELSAANDVPGTYSYAGQYLGKYKNGQVSKTWNANTTTWYKYNPSGQLFASIKQVNDADYATYGGTGDLSIKTYENAYDPYFGYVTNNYFQKNVTTEYAEHQFAYDAKKRLTQVNLIAGLGSTPISLNTLSYDKLGRTARQVYGGTLQGIDYVYTLNNTLKAINHPSLSSDKDRGLDHAYFPKKSLTLLGINDDLFGEILEYYPNDYKRTGTSIETNTNGLYNGQIYGQRYKTRDIVNGINTGADYIDYLGANIQIISATNYTQQEVANRYTYDAFGQLATSTFGTFTNTTNSFTPRTDYQEYGVTNGAIGYDANGNVSRLQRNSFSTAAAPTTPVLLDNLTYNYSTSNNKHNQVTDACTNTFASTFNFKNQTSGSPATFVYNAHGQLTSSPDENITAITYYPNGQTKQITFTNGNTTNYYYDDQGQKYKTKFYNNSTATTKYTWYLFNAIYEYQTAGAFSLKELSVGGQSRVGVYKQDVAGLNIANGHVQYELKDHLGNVRVTFRDYIDANGNHFPQALSRADYYAFGGTLPGRVWQDVTGDYRYGYQGQEKSQNDVNWDNFELRTYNHDLGRWSAPDPYGQFHSPYLAMGNNPVNNIDPNGGYMNNNVFYDMRSYWVGIGNAQRSQDYDLMLRHLGPYSQSAMYESYKEKLASLYANVYGGGVMGEDESGSGHGGRDVQYMNALYELNNEYIGMGLANNSLSSGMSVVSFNTIINNQGLVFNLTNQNGEAATFAAADGVTAHPINFDARADMYSNNAFNNTHREYIDKWRAKKWAEQDAIEAKEKAYKKEQADWDKNHPDLSKGPSHGGVASAAGTYTPPSSYGHNGIGVNLGGGIGLMGQAIEINFGFFVNSNGIGQSYFSYGTTVKMPIYLNAGVSAQLLYIHTDANKIDLSGNGNTAGLGLGPVSGSYSFSTDSEYNNTDIYGLGTGYGIKYSGGYTDTKTFTTPFVLWFPSMMPGH